MTYLKMISEFYLPLLETITTLEAQPWTNCFEKVLLARIIYSVLAFILFKKINSVRLLTVLRGHSVFSSPPQRPMISDFEGFLSQILSITFFPILNFIYFTTKQVIQLILIMLVGTDVCVRMVFVWEETGVPGGKPPVWLGDHMTISHADAGYRTLTHYGRFVLTLQVYFSLSYIN